VNVPSSRLYPHAGAVIHCPTFASPVTGVTARDEVLEDETDELGEEVPDDCVVDVISDVVDEVVIDDDVDDDVGLDCVDV
jgi:hypothetical protein